MGADYHATVRTVLVTPIGLGVPGNGLSQRCAMWADALSELGHVTRIVVPVVGPSDEDPNVVIVEPNADREPLVPELARGVTTNLGLLIGNNLYDEVGPVDVVVGVRSYLGDFCIGLRDALAARLVIDLDDDDAAFFAARGDHDEAERFNQLLKRLSSEANLLTSAQGFGESLQLANGVAVPELVRRDRSREVAPAVLFLGNMGYQPNFDAAQLLIDEIAPEILQQLPNARIVIAGPGSEVFGSRGLGFVDDLEQLMEQTDVLVVPLREGSGTRIKILDAWAHGVPVVSTAVGAEGLGAIDNHDVLIADEPLSIAKAVLRLINDVSLAEGLARNGRNAVAAQFTREHVVAYAKEIISHVLHDLFDSGEPRLVVPVAIESLHLVETETGLIVLNTSTGDVHELDTSASVVFSLIDGTSTVENIAATIQSIFELGELPMEAAESAISSLVEIGIVTRIRLHGNRLRLE